MSRLARWAMRFTAVAALLVVAGNTLAAPERVWTDVEQAEVRRDVHELVRRAHDATVRLLGREPKTTGRLHLYHDRHDFAVVESRMTRGAFARNGAFTAHTSGDAHIALQPAVPDEVLDEFGLPGLTRRLVAHEAAHVTVFGALESPDRHPTWLAEGLACVVADRALGVADDLDCDPMASTRLVRCRRLLADGHLPRIVDILDDRMPGLGFDERYALWWAVTTHLVREAPDALESALAAADRGAEAVRVAVEDELGPRIDALDNSFAAWIESSEPRWDEERRALTVLGDDELLQSSFDVAAVAWRVGPPGDGWSIQTTARVVHSETAEPAAALLLRRDDDTLVIRIVPGYGIVLERRDARGTDERLDSATVRGFPVGGELAITVRVHADRLTVRAGRKARLELDELGPVHRIGLQTTPRTTTHWRKLRLP